MYEHFEFPGAGIDDIVAVRRIRRAIAAMAMVLGRAWESHGLLGASIDDIVVVDGYDETVIVRGFAADMARTHFKGYKIIEI